MKIFLYLIYLFPLSVLAQTISCPTVTDIKNNQFHSWLPLYVNNEELVSALDRDQFRQAVIRFDKAKWDALYLENGHCFYQGSDDITKNIILAHDAWRPDNADNWLWNATKSFAECREEICRFVG